LAFALDLINIFLGSEVEPPCDMWKYLSFT